MRFTVVAASGGRRPEPSRVFAGSTAWRHMLVMTGSSGPGGTILARCRMIFDRSCPQRVVIADGAMGTMLQGYDLTLADFDGLEGCNEVLNRTRPDVVRAIHDAYFDAGVDAVETNTFGANLGRARRVRHRRPDLRAVRGRRRGSPGSPPTRYATPDRPRCVLGSVGPGTKLPTLGHVSFAALRDAYQAQVEGLLDRRHRRGADRDLPGPAADPGGRRWAPSGRWPPPAATCRSSSTSRWRPPARCCSAPRSARR